MTDYRVATVVHAHAQPVEQAPHPRRLLRLVYKFLLLSLAAHVVGLLIFGGLVILKKLRPEEVTFEAPVQVKKVEPKKREYKLRAKQQQQRSSRPKLQPRLQSQRVSDVALPVVDTKITPIKNNLTDIPGIGEGIGEGFGFGSGDGIGIFMGTKIQGGLAVILDTIGSLFSTVFLVTEEIEDNFQSAIKVGIRGAAFYDDKVVGNRLVPIDESKQWRSYIEGAAGQSTKKNLREIGRSLAKRDLGFTYEMESRSKVRKPQSTRRDKKPITVYQSLGTAIELLLKDPSRPGTIYVFSDFMDGVDTSYMRRLQGEVKRYGVKVVFWNPNDSWRQDEKYYQEFAKATGGEVKTGGLKKSR